MTVELFTPRHLAFEQVPAPAISSQHRRARDDAWTTARTTNPHLFDGPAVACAHLSPQDSGDLVLQWFPVTYRHFALRRVPGANYPLGSVFVTIVQPSEDGRVLVGQMSATTAAAGRWQLPGGSVEPSPPSFQQFDLDSVRRHAARELREEVGVDASPDHLTLCALTRGEHGNIGIHFRAPALPAPQLREHHAVVTRRDVELGHMPEFQDIAMVASTSELDALAGPRADYLAHVLRQATVGRSREWELSFERANSDGSSNTG